MKPTIKDVKHDKDGYYIEINIRTRLPVVFNTVKSDNSKTLSMVYDVEGYLRDDVGLSMLYRILDLHWKRNDYPELPSADKKLVDRFFDHWYQLKTFESLGLDTYPILLDITDKEKDKIPYVEFTGEE